MSYLQYENIKQSHNSDGVSAKVLGICNLWELRSAEISWDVSPVSPEILAKNCKDWHIEKMEQHEQLAFRMKPSLKPSFG